MSGNRLPPMEPLAPIIDQMRDLAREELPSPRTCDVSLWDDGTFSVIIYHSMGKTNGRENERQHLRYERTTSEILWEYFDDGRWEPIWETGSETLYGPEFDECEVRMITTVEPPYD